MRIDSGMMMLTRLTNQILEPRTKEGATLPFIPRQACLPHVVGCYFCACCTLVIVSFAHMASIVSS